LHLWLAFGLIEGASFVWTCKKHLDTEFIYGTYVKINPRIGTKLDNTLNMIYFWHFILFMATAGRSLGLGSYFGKLWACV